MYYSTHRMDACVHGREKGCRKCLFMEFVSSVGEIWYFSDYFLQTPISISFDCVAMWTCVSLCLYMKNVRMLYVVLYPIIFLTVSSPVCVWISFIISLHKMCHHRSLLRIGLHLLHIRNRRICTTYIHYLLVHV